MFVGFYSSKTLWYRPSLEWDPWGPAWAPFKLSSFLLATPLRMCLGLPYPGNQGVYVGFPWIRVAYTSFAAIMGVRGRQPMMTFRTYLLLSLGMWGTMLRWSKGMSTPPGGWGSWSSESRDRLLSVKGEISCWSGRGRSYWCWYVLGIAHTLVTL